MKKKIVSFVFLILVSFHAFSQHPFILKIHFNDPQNQSLSIGEAYWPGKPYHAATIYNNSGSPEKGVYTFRGTVLYPTAIRIFQPSKTTVFNKLIFIDSGSQEITILKKENSYEVESNTPVENERRSFLKQMAVHTMDDQLNGERFLEYVKEHPRSYIALFALINQASNFPYPEIFKKVEAAFDKQIKNTKSFQYYLSVFDPKLNHPVDSLALGKSSDGTEINLSSFRDKDYVLFDFWASWCAPCRASVPELKKLYKKYHQKGLEIISIGSSLSDLKGDWAKASQKDGLNRWVSIFSEPPYPAGKDIGIKYGVTAIPTTILIDKKGEIIGRYESDLPALEKQLKKIFQ